MALNTYLAAKHNNWLAVGCNLIGLGMSDLRSAAYNLYTAIERVDAKPLHMAKMGRDSWANIFSLPPILLAESWTVLAGGATPVTCVEIDVWLFCSLHLPLICLRPDH